MTDGELARYLARLQDARTEADLEAIELDLRAQPAGRERDTLLRVLNAMRWRWTLVG
jgi:hypothetical protein